MFPPTFQLLSGENKKLELSEAAQRLKKYIIENGIEVVVLDSLVDFFQGDENNPVDIARFSAICDEIFPDCCVIFIHHESKPAQNAPKRNPGQRMRGSTHIFNMLNSALSLTVNDQEKPEIILVEHSKVRGGKKFKPFEVRMIIEPDPQNDKETIVKGFEYLGEVIPSKRKVEEAEQEIKNIASSHPTEWYSTNQYKNFLRGKVGSNNIIIGLKNLARIDYLLTSKGARNADLYRFNQVKAEEEVIDPEVFIHNLEKDEQNSKNSI